MAVMQTCCCCGVRPGSIASAIYSMVIAIIGAIYYGYGATAFAFLVDAFGETSAWLNVWLSVYILAVVVFIVVIITSIIAIVGVSKDTKGMLIPFMVAKCLHLLWYLYVFIVDAVFLSELADVFALGYAFLATIVLLVPFLIGDIVCLLCVISQYQELDAGRGRATPQATVNQTVYIQQQAAPPPTITYVSGAPQQGPPPKY